MADERKEVSTKRAEERLDETGVRLYYAVASVDKYRSVLSDSAKQALREYEVMNAEASRKPPEI